LFLYAPSVVLGSPLWDRNRPCNAPISVAYIVHFTS